ncbi:uncharacterized protein LOC142349997 [Convolutriloba macropyga]|uniref:uncharacterized protein LOC142349997 n=1 Tax=Convolutriloba macropyga TaxID=536237 RepID=UPI003F51FA6F
MISDTFCFVLDIICMATQQVPSQDPVASERSSNLKDFKILVSKCRIKTELDADTAIEISRALTEAYVKYKLANLPEKAETGVKDSYNHALKSLKNLKPTYLKTQIPAPPPPVVHKASSSSTSKNSKRKSKGATEATSEKRSNNETTSSSVNSNESAISSAVYNNSTGSSTAAGISIPFAPNGPMSQGGFPLPPHPPIGVGISSSNNTTIPQIPPGPPMMPQPPPGMFPTSMPQMPLPPTMPPQMPSFPQPGVPQMPQPPPFMPGMPVSSAGFVPPPSGLNQNIPPSA